MEDTLSTKTADYLDDLHAKYEQEKAFYEKKYQKQNTVERKAKVGSTRLRRTWKRTRYPLQSPENRLASKKSAMKTLATESSLPVAETCDSTAGGNITSYDRTEDEPAAEQREESSQFPANKILRSNSHGTTQAMISVRYSTTLSALSDSVLPSTYSLTQSQKSVQTKLATNNNTPLTTFDEQRSLALLSSAPSNPVPELPDLNSPLACSNCGATSSKGGWLRSPLQTGRRRCRPCYQYEVRTGRLRPLSLEAIRGTAWKKRKRNVVRKAVAKSSSTYSSISSAASIHSPPPPSHGEFDLIDEEARRPLLQMKRIEVDAFFNKSATHEVLHNEAGSWDAVYQATFRYGETTSQKQILREKSSGLCSINCRYGFLYTEGHIEEYITSTEEEAMEDFRADFKQQTGGHPWEERFTFVSTTNISESKHGQYHWVGHSVDNESIYPQPDN